MYSFPHCKKGRPMLCLQRGEDHEFHHTITSGICPEKAARLNGFNAVKKGCCQHKKALKRTLIVLIFCSVLFCALVFAAITLAQLPEEILGLKKR